MFDLKTLQGFLRTNRGDTETVRLSQEKTVSFRTVERSVQRFREEKTPEETSRSVCADRPNAPDGEKDECDPCTKI